jgi:hypothetical protein
MGNLPKNRVQLKFPFYNAGVDYCGLFYVKSGLVRSRKITKSYAAVFVFLATKAIHLELVSDMTTKAFMAALDRFYSDHGLSANMYSDNGSNFLGAAAEIDRQQQTIYSNDGQNVSSANSGMSEVADLLQSKEFQKEIVEKDGARRITWHFIPPHAPEFGGLWEAAVKSVKFHIVRQLGQALLTFEEFQTVLKKIAAILNSRPLFPESEDINDYSAITPAHFLIGRAMTFKPEENVVDVATNRLDRWQRIQKHVQQFHQAWRKDYLHGMQQRTKRYKERVELKIGDLVVMVEDNISSFNWPLARIIDTHPGSDGIIRVVTVRNQHGIYKRPVAKVCLIPIESPAFQGGENVVSFEEKQ